MLLLLLGQYVTVSVLINVSIQSDMASTSFAEGHPPVYRW